MTGDPKPLHLLIGQLRAFAAVTTRSAQGCDTVVLQVLRDFEAVEPADTLAVFRELYRRLRLLADGVETLSFRALPGAASDWRNFEQLRDGQRSAVFLVIGLEFSIEDTAQVLCEPEDWVTLEVMSAMFCMEHALPERSQAKSKRNPLGPTRSFAPLGALHPPLTRPPTRPFRSTRSVRHGLPAN